MVYIETDKLAADDTGPASAQGKPSRGPLCSRADLRRALFSPRFEIFITVLLVLNALILGALTYSYNSGNLASQSWVGLLTGLDMFIVAIFAAEMVAKICASGRDFFKSGWNIFDLGVVAISFFGGVYPLSVLRSLRVLRTLRLVTQFQSMRIVVESFMRAIPGIAAVLGVMLIILYVYAVIGTRLFGTIAPDLFGTLHDSVFTMFMVLTLEGWPDIAMHVIPHADFARLFFVSYIALNSFTALNLMIAVIIDAMQREYEDTAEEEREDILDELKALRADIAALKKS